MKLPCYLKIATASLMLYSSIFAQSFVASPQKAIDPLHGKFSLDNSARIGQLMELTFSVTPQDVDKIVNGVIVFQEGITAESGESQKFIVRVEKQGDEYKNIFKISLESDGCYEILVNMKGHSKAGNIINQTYSIFLIAENDLCALSTQRELHFFPSVRDERINVNKQKSKHIGELKRKESYPGTESVTATVNITGKYTYDDIDDGMVNKPVKYATVKVIETGLLGGVKGESKTDDQGHYTIPINITGAKELFVKIFCETEAGEVNPGFPSGPYESDTPSKIVDPALSATCDFGVENFPAQFANWAALDDMTDEYFWFESHCAYKRSRIDIGWPVGKWAKFRANGYTNWIELCDRAILAWDRTAVLHEYGHSIMYSLYGNSMPEGWGPDPHYIFDESSGGFALNEGLAEFISAAIDDNPDLVEDMGMNIETNTWHKLVGSYVYNGDIVEGSVASILWDIFDSRTNDDDPLSFGINDINGSIFSILKDNNPQDINEFWTSWIGKYPNSREALSAIYFMYGINKDNTSPSVSITNPVNNSNVGGIVPITAIASDNESGIRHVEFFADDQSLGAITKPPYSVQWNTSAFPSKRYALKAIARDNAGNTAESSVWVTLGTTAALSNGSVSPASGSSNDQFEFDVFFKSSNAPNSIYLVLDGQNSNMLSTDENWSTGALFTAKKANLSIGRHQFYFTASTNGQNIRFPEAGEMSFYVIQSTVGWDASVRPTTTNYSPSVISAGTTITVNCEIFNGSDPGNAYTGLAYKAELRAPDGSLADESSSILPLLEPNAGKIMPLTLHCPSNAANGTWSIIVSVLPVVDSNPSNNSQTLYFYIGPKLGNELYVTTQDEEEVLPNESISIGGYPFMLMGINTHSTPNYAVFRDPGGSTKNIYQDHNAIFSAYSATIAVSFIASDVVYVHGGKAVSSGPSFVQNEVFVRPGQTAYFEGTAPGGLYFDNSKDEYEIYTLGSSISPVGDWFNSFTRGNNGTTAQFGFEIPQSASSGSYTLYLYTQYTTGTNAYMSRLKLTVLPPLPSITQLSKNHISPGEALTITGINLGTAGKVLFENIEAITISSWTPTSIVLTVPPNVSDGNLYVVNSNGTSNGMPYGVIPLPVFWTLTASAQSGGRIEPSGTVSVANGASQLFIITPDDGYQIADVRVDAVSKGSISSYSFANVMAEHSISAMFSTKAHTLALRNGWSIISSYVKPSNSGLENIFASIIPDVIILKNGSGKSYIQSEAVNTIGTWVETEGYQIKMAHAQSVNITGSPITPEATAISLPKDWSILPYFYTTAASISTVLAPLIPAIIMVKDQDGKPYLPSESIDEIKTMNAGQGYQIKLRTAQTFTYPAQTGTASFAVVEPNDTTEEQTHYRATISTGDNATILIPSRTVAVRMKPGDELAVYDRRGLLTGSAPFKGKNFAITVWGDDPTTPEKDGMVPGEEYEISCWRKDIGDEMKLVGVQWQEGRGVFEINGIDKLGSIVTSVPTTVPTSFVVAQNYPNPFNPSTNIVFSLPAEGRVRITIFNVLGQNISELLDQTMDRGYHVVPFNAQSLPSGVYYYMIAYGNETHVSRMTLLK